MTRSVKIFRILQVLIIAFSLAAVTSGVSAAECFPQARGSKAFGIRGGYNTRNESPSAGLFFQYSMSSRVRLSANVDYIFSHNNTDAYSISLNAHYSLIRAGRFTIYPLAGVSYTSWHLKNSIDNSSDISTRSDYLGLNLGAGMDYRITSTLKLNLECKYNAMKNHSAGVFNIGIAYCF